MVWTAWWMMTMAPALGQAPSSGAVNVAVVDVPRVSEQYERTPELEAKFEQRRLQFNQHRKELRDQIDRLNQALKEQFKPGTDAFDERRKQLVTLQAELDWYTETESQKIEAGLAGALQQIYLDIQAAIREVAERRGIDIVLAADHLPPDAPPTTGQARQQIMLQKVVYWNPRVDITDAVIKRLNERYRAKKLASPGGAGGGQPTP